ncbi:MAG: hypothetical protein WBL88_00225, partial [Nitrososphaeraceae archaeon]
SSSLHVLFCSGRFDQLYHVISASFVSGCNSCAYERLVSVQTVEKSVPKARRVIVVIPSYVNDSLISVNIREASIT